MLYYADNVFADQTEQYPEICKSLTRSRETYYRHSCYCIFFLGFLFFMYQINTARGMVVNDNGKEGMRVTRVIEKVPLGGNM